MSVEDFLKKLARVTEARGQHWSDCLHDSTSMDSTFRNTLRMIINEEISAIASVTLNEIQPSEEEEKTMICPHCGNNLKVKLEKAPATKKRIKKDPNELVSVEQFIQRNRKSNQKHVKIIAEWADELKQSDMLNGQQLFSRTPLEPITKIRHKVRYRIASLN